MAVQHLRQEVEQESALYRKQVREIKEMFSSPDGEPTHLIRIKDRDIVLTETEIQDAIKDKFIRPACHRLAVYVKAVKDLGRHPYLLLVGGSAKLKELAVAFKREFQCEVISDCDRAEFATVLGACCPSQYEYGMENFKNRNYTAAITALKRAIELDPLDRKAYTGLGQAYFNWGNTKFELKQYNAAVTDYDEAIRINPEYHKAYYKRGNAKCHLGEYNAAITDFDQAIRINPEFADAYNNRGNAKCHLGEYNAAITDFDQAIRINPNQILAYHNRGNVKSSLGQYEAAITDYDEAIRINPEYHESHYSRGNAKRDLGEYNAAITDYDEAIRINPELTDAYNNRGLIKCNLGQYRAAITDYDEAIRINPEYYKAYNNRRNAKRKMIELLSENYPEALRQLDELSPILLKLTTEPKHQTVLKVLPRLLEKCIEDLSTERLKPIWVNLKECEDVILSNMHLCYLNRSKEPFRFDRHGRLRLTHLGFWHGLGHDHKTLSQLMGIAKQLEEYSERLLPFLCDPDLLEYYEQALAANSYDFSLRNFFFNHRESFKCLERLTETPIDTEQKDKFWNLHKEAASSLETVMNGRIRALAKEAEHSDVHPQHRGSVVSSFSGCNELLKGAFDSFTVDQRLPEDVRELFEIGVTDGLFRFIGATSEVQTEIETRLSNLYTLNRNIHYELKSPLNDEFEKNRVPSPRDLKTFFDYFGLDSPKKVTQDQVVVMLF